MWDLNTMARMNAEAKKREFSRLQSLASCWPLDVAMLFDGNKKVFSDGKFCHTRQIWVTPEDELLSFHPVFWM